MCLQSLLKKLHFLKHDIWTTLFSKFQSITQVRLVFLIRASTYICLLVFAGTYQIDQNGQFQLKQFKKLVSNKSLNICLDSSSFILSPSTSSRFIFFLACSGHKSNTAVGDESHAVWIKRFSPLAPIAFTYNFSPGSCSKTASKKTLSAFFILLWHSITGPIREEQQALSVDNRMLFLKVETSKKCLHFWQ